MNMEDDDVIRGVNPNSRPLGVLLFKNDDRLL
jgi:hypothetical protein